VAVLKNHPLLSPNHTLGIYSLVWPKAACQFASGGFAWKHYTIDAPAHPGHQANGRPVVFVLGYSLDIGLADYLDWAVYEVKMDPNFLALPAVCAAANITTTVGYGGVW
jgi:hypothetical protein